MKPNLPVYVIKPKYIFKTPFLKYDLQNPTNREAQNEELTEYFNYGFNEDTMNIYVKLVNRMLKVLDHKKNLEYFDEPSELMRLNDEIPMDLGGFGKFYDPEVFKNDFIQNDQQLLKHFLFYIVSASCFTGKQYPTYPMLQFVKSMYPPKKTDKDQDNKQENTEPNALTEMVAQITRNLEQKYEETMRKLIEQKNQPKEIHPSTNPFKKGKFQRKPYPESKQEERVKEEDKQQRKQVSKKKERKQRSSSSSSESSSSGTSSDSSSSSSSESEDERKKRPRDKKERVSRKDNKRERRSKSRSKDQWRKDRKQSRHESRKDLHREPRNERRDSRNEERHRDKKRSEHRRSRSRDNRSHRR